jgi:hypothetical protein
MKNGPGCIILLALLLGLTVGCSKRTTRVDLFYGTSYQLAKESQINNPDAGIHTGPSVGLQGPVAASVIDRYEKGFENSAAKTEIYSIDVGGMNTK